MQSIAESTSGYRSGGSPRLGAALVVFFLMLMPAWLGVLDAPIDLLRQAVQPMDVAFIPFETIRAADPVGSAFICAGIAFGPAGLAYMGVALGLAIAGLTRRYSVPVPRGALPNLS